MAETSQAQSLPEISAAEVAGGGGLSDIAQEVLAETRTSTINGLSKKLEKKDKAAEAKKVPDAKAVAGSDLKKAAPQATKTSVGGFEKDNEVAPQEFELNVNGKKYLSKGLDDLKAKAQRGIAAEQSMQQMRSEYNQAVQRLQEQMAKIEERENLLKTNPAKYIKSLNDRAEDVAEQLLLDRAKEHLAMENMTPRERELYLQNKKYQEAIAQREEQEKAAAEDQEKQLVKSQMKTLGDAFAKVLTDHSLPANNTTVRVMAAIYRAHLNGNQPINEQRLAELTRRQLSQMAPDISKMEAEDFVSKYPDLTESIRKHLVAKVQGTEQPRRAEAKKSTRSIPDYSQRDVEDANWEKDIKKLVQDGSIERVKMGWF